MTAAIEDGIGEWKDGKFRCKLSKPIEADGETVSILTIREPSTEDIIECGNPVSFDPMKSPPTITPDDVRMAKMIARLAGIPPSSLKKMAPKDFLALQWVVVPFFMPV